MILHNEEEHIDYLVDAVRPHLADGIQNYAAAVEAERKPGADK
jgi:hypothetical protein